jgi:N-glycosylase/DNA lyase
VGDDWVGVDGEQAYSLGGSREISALVGKSADASAHSQSLARFFRLDWHYPSVLEELVERGPELAPLLPGAEGLRLLRPSCPREALFSFLCTSNNHITRIAQMVGKLAAYGEPLAPPQDEPLGEGRSERRFPSLERLAEVTEQELREKGFGYRARTIPRVAHELLARGGERYLEETKAKPYQDVYAELIPLPGVGPKLADCIALYAFDKTEAVPIDVHMWRAACPVYFPQWSGTDLNDSKRRALGDLLRTRFGTLAGVAQQILFYTSLTAKR